MAKRINPNEPGVYVKTIARWVQRAMFGFLEPFASRLMHNVGIPTLPDLMEEYYRFEPPTGTAAFFYRHRSVFGATTADFMPEWKRRAWRDISATRLGIIKSRPHGSNDNERTHQPE